MNTSDILPAISARYNDLAEQACCLSCGSAVDKALAQPGEVCLDLGCGRGADALRLAEAVGDRGRVYGVDVTPGMLATARRTAEKLGVTNVEWLHATLDHVPLPSALVDLAISNCTINHAPDKHAVWAEVFRLLKPGGRAVVSDIYALLPVPAVYRDSPTAVAECWAGAVTREAYLTSLATTGFPKVEILEESAPYDKGAIRVASMTFMVSKPNACCCSNQ